MPNKRARERQLAKLAARRQSERRHAKRRRDMTLGAGGVLAAIVLIVIGFQLLTKDSGTAATTTPSSSTTSPTPEPGTLTGTVKPTPAPAKVACGAKKPVDADKPKPQFAGPPTLTIDQQATYSATLRTSCGDIVIELDPSQAPQTVNSFVFLAKHGYFDGTYFHRLDTSIDVIQGGDPTGTGGGGPGYSIPDELTGSESYKPGTLAMANGNDPTRGLANTGGSQFFIITGPNGFNLDDNPNYTIFGHIVKGLDVARQIQQLPIKDPSAGISGQRPKVAIYIEKVTIKVEKQKPSESSSTETPAP